MNPDRRHRRLPLLRRSVFVAPVGVLAVLLLAACSTSPRETAATGTAPTQPSIVAASRGVTVATSPLPASATRVNALVATDGGQVFAATDSGLFTVSPTTDRRIGASTTDMASLAIDTTGVLYTSGHPTPSASTQTVGLLRSTDGGITWQRVSGTDTDDFHALTARGSTIVGESEGRLWVSTDGGQRWERSTRPDVASLTLDSHDLWITGDTGLVRAKADGTSTEAVSDAPRLLLGSLAADKTVWGVDTSGAIWTRDEHERWHEIGTIPGAVPATGITGIDATHAALATAAGITWITVTDPSLLPTVTIT